MLKESLIRAGLGLMLVATASSGQNPNDGPVAAARKDIVAAYQRSLDCSGDADGALQMDTEDWASITTGQKPRIRKELVQFIRRDFDNLKPGGGALSGGQHTDINHQ